MTATKWLPPIRVWADNNAYSGLNNALRGFLQALQHLGADSNDVYVAPISNGTGLYQELGEHDWLHSYIYQPTKEDKINIVLHHPSHLPSRYTTIDSRYNVAYCPWETDKLPKQYVDAMNKYDQVWAPSQLTASVFKRSGVTQPVHTVPHALTQEFLDATAAWKTRDAHEETLFYFIGSTNPRKNPEGLIRAWCQSIGRGWNRNSPVNLTLHLVPAARDVDSVSMAAEVTRMTVEQYVKSLGEQKDCTPPWRLLMAPRGLDYIVKMHLNNDVFVTSSRGESFNLAAAEAAAVGNVVVGTSYALPCLVDLRSDFKSIPFDQIDSRLTPISPMPEVAGFELDQNWWEPLNVLDALIELAQPDKFPLARAHARVFAPHVRESLAPRNVAKVIEPLLREAADVVARSGW